MCWWSLGQSATKVSNTLFLDLPVQVEVGWLLEMMLTTFCRTNCIFFGGWTKTKEASKSISEGCEAI